MVSRPRVDSNSLLERLRTANYREQLEALRDELVVALENSPAGAKAQTAAQLRAVLKDLASLPDAKKVSKADELASRRKARLAAADLAAPAVGDNSQ
jgi:hypothetical protein